MKHLTTILIEKGYEPWRYSCVYPTQNADAKNQNSYILKNKGKYNVVFIEGNETEGIFYFKPIQPYYDFSTMRTGGVTTYWVKDKDFKNSIIWGMNEFGKPPTLISPRPKIKYHTEKNDRRIILSEQFDNAMNICLQKENHEIVFEAMFDSNITFEYETSGNR
jgi:hypothetical protein